MNVDTQTQLTSELSEISLSVSRLLANEYAAEQRRQALCQKPGAVPAIWSAIAQMGIFSINIPEQYGGYDLSSADFQPLFHEFGSALLVAPWLSHMLAMRAIVYSGSEQQKTLYLPPAAEGRLILGYVSGHIDRTAGTGSDSVQAEKRESETWHISGAKRCVPHADLYDYLVIKACISNTEAQALFIVDRKDASITSTTYRMMDGSFAQDLDFVNVPARLLGMPSDSGVGETEKHLLQFGQAAVCGEAAGLMEAAIDQTVEYLKIRKQFGVYLRENQALQHRIAEMFVRFEQVRSMARLAMTSVFESDLVDQTVALAQAKLLVGRYGKWITQQAIQLHGGVGMTDEYAIGHFYRRMLVIDRLFGDENSQLKTLTSCEFFEFN